MGGVSFRLEQQTDYPWSGTLRLSIYPERRAPPPLEREWEAGDLVELTFPIPVRKVVSDTRVAENRGKAALQRGPLVYCVEGRDAAAWPVEMGQEDSLQMRWEPGLLRGLMAVNGPKFMAIPYYAWKNRGAGTMQVWLQDASC